MKINFTGNLLCYKLNYWDGKGCLKLLISEIKDYLQKNLRENRYEHVLGVVQTAIALAKLNNVDEKKAEIAALCHDVAKNKTIAELEQLINENKIELSYEEIHTKELWHSIVSPSLGRDIFNIEDEEILNAMRWHTTGRENMTKLEKIIYIADMIEPGRNFPGVQELRQLTFLDLDKGVLEGLNHTIGYLLSMNSLIDSNTIKARNYLLVNQQDKI